MAAPAQAQSNAAAAAPAAAPCAQPDASGNCPSEGVVVTGSRIRRTEFTSPSPIQVITSEQSTLEGLTDTAQILQQSTIAENANQINNFFTGFLVGGGSGANTLSLRGLGAQRTLILLNGKRMGPAGIGGTVASVDLNTIPSSIIDHTEILKDGASSIYGSDAIAGVVNIITKANRDGGDVNVTVNPGQRPGGEQWDASASWGKTFNRGHIQLGAEIFRQEALHIGQRSYLNCAQDLAVDPTTGKSLAITDPKTGREFCQNIFVNAVENASTGGQIYVPNSSAVLGQNNGTSLNGWQRVAYVVHQPGTFTCTSGGLTGTFTYAAGDPRLVGNTAPCVVRNGVLTPTGSDNLPIDIAGTESSLLNLNQNNQQYQRQSAISPARRYSIFGSGAYDLDAHNQVYGELLWNRRVSSQDSYAQFFPAVNVNNPFNPFNPANPGFAGVAGFAQPILLKNASNAQQVDYSRVVLGIRGDLPPLFGFLKGWDYDLYGQYAHSYASYHQNFIYNDRVNATAGAGASGCDPNTIAPGGSGLTLAQHEGANAACVPVNYFSNLVVNTGFFSPAEAAYLYGYSTGHTTYDHMYVEGSVSGDLLTLPAGPVGAALGFQVRREKLNDTPDKEAQAQNFWGSSTAGITAGTDDIEEAFAEFRIPLLKALPFVEHLNLSASGRYSNYKSFGGTGTGAIGVDWQITDWFRARATHNTGFRAPALTELFLGNLVGFQAQNVTDPCINYGLSSNAALQKNCASQGIAPNYNGFSPTSNTSVSATVTGGGGLVNHLKPESSRSDTIGFVFTPHWYGLDFSIATDWYHTKVLNQVQQFGAFNIVASCYTSANFPTDPFCSLFTRDLNPKSNTFQEITSVQNNFVNVASQVDEGLDVTTRFRHRLPYDVNFTMDSQLSWTFFEKTVLLNGAITNTLGGTRFPQFVGNVNFRFDRGPWTLNWFVNMIGHSSDDNTDNLAVANPALQLPALCAGSTNGTLCGGFHGTGLAAYRNFVLPFTAINNISIRRRYQDFTITMGVKNLFDHTPDAYSIGGNSRIGDTRLRSQEDLIGRSFFLSVDKRF